MQQLHSNNPTVANANFAPFDAHNFLELAWSEPVDIGGLAANAENVRSDFGWASAPVGLNASNGGDYRAGSATSGRAVLDGFFETLGTGYEHERGAKSGPATANALYRRFSTDGNPANAQNWPHRLRVYIAGFAEDGTVLDPSWKWSWPGWLKGLDLPAGVVRSIANANIRDRGAGAKPIEPTVDSGVSGYAASGYEKTAISIDSTAAGVYGAWDVSPPVFARVNREAARSLDLSSLRIAEAVPVDINGNSLVDRVEFHIMDNATFGSGNPAPLHWISMRGFTDTYFVEADPVAARTAYDTPYFSRPDSYGGARPVGSGGPNAFSSAGGIRDSSLTAAAALAFSLRDGSSGTFANGFNQGFATAVNSRIFADSSLNVLDDPFIALRFNEAAPGYTWSARSALEFAYSETGRITDLAGNLLESISSADPLLCVERQPPRVQTTLAANGGNSMYLKFTEDVILGSANKSEIIQFDDPYTVWNGYIVSIDRHRGSGYEFLVSFNRPITTDFLLNARLKPFEVNVTDPLTGDPIAGSNIVDGVGNTMLPSERHRISDLGINLVEALSASDGVREDGLYGTGIGALRAFDGSGALFDRDISVAAKVWMIGPSGPDLAMVADRSLQLFYDVNPDAASRLSFSSGAASISSELWLPSIVASLFNPGLTANRAARQLAPSVIQNATRQNQDFLIPSNDAEIADGAMLEFIFRYGDLYCARLTDPADLLSFAPWKIRIEDVKPQRGDVTILNNVIDSGTGEYTVVNVNLRQAGMLSVQVYTLDGALVKILYRGRQSVGEYSYRWDATNAQGDKVARGVYFVRVLAPGVDEIRKVLVVRN